MTDNLCDKRYGKKFENSKILINFAITTLINLYYFSKQKVKFNEISSQNKESFYFNLNLENITKNDDEHAYLKHEKYRWL